MRVKDKETGGIVGMRYDPAVAAVRAGTHEFVNDQGLADTGPSDADGSAEAGAQLAPDEKGGGSSTPIDDMSKDELLAEAKRLGLDEAKPAMRKDEIFDLVKDSLGAGGEQAG